jgi:hypothetical protein
VPDRGKGLTPATSSVLIESPTARGPESGRTERATEAREAHLEVVKGPIVDARGRREGKSSNGPCTSLRQGHGAPDHRLQPVTARSVPNLAAARTWLRFGAISPQETAHARVSGEGGRGQRRSILRNAMRLGE